MKRVILSALCLALFAAWNLYSQPGTDVYAQILSLSSEDESLISQTFTKRYDHLPVSEQENNLKELQQKVVFARLTFGKNQYIVDVLTLIDQLAAMKLSSLSQEETPIEEEIQDTASSEPDSVETTQENKDIAFLEGFSPDAYQKGTKIVLAGTQSQPVVTRELIAQREQIMLETLELEATVSIDRAVRNVLAVDESGRILGMGRPQGNTATIRDINYLLPLGGTDIYIVLETYETGKTKEGESISSFSFDLTATGVGQRSDATITKNYEGSDDIIRISPIKIIDARLIKSYDQYTVDTRLYDENRTDIALFVIETAPSENYRTDTPTETKTRIQQLRFRFFNGTTDSNVGTTFQLERADKNTAKIPGALNGNEVTFDTTLLSKEGNIIENGDRAVFLISAIVDLDPARDDEFVEISLDDQDNGGILYGADSPAASLLNGLFLQKEINSLTLEE